MPKYIRALGVLALIAGVGLGQVQTPPATARTDDDSKPIHLEGKVASLNGDSVRKASVRLQPNGGIGIAAGANRPGSYSATTDDAGKFSFDNVAPGRYTLTAEKTGFLSGRYGSRSEGSPAVPISVSAGDNKKNLDIKMTPQGVIVGRVTDEDGDPVAKAQITVSHYVYTNGRKTLTSAGGGLAAAANGGAADPAATAAALQSILGGGGQTSDDQGNFRIGNLAPGRYYVSVNPRGEGGILGMIAGAAAAAGGQPTTTTTKPSREAINITTYYPNSIDLQGAVEVDVPAGGELRGIDIRLRKEAVYSIRGKIVDASTGNPVTGAMVVSIPPDASEADPTAILGNLSTTANDGTFEIRNLLPGKYGIQAMSLPQLANLNNNQQGPAGQSAALEAILSPKVTTRLDVGINSSDANNVVLQLTDGMVIPGIVKMDEGDLKDHLTTPAPAGNNQNATAAAQALLANRITLNMAEGVNLANPNGRYQEDGTFKINGVFPVKYFVNLLQLPAGIYIKSIKLSGREITKAPLDLTNGAPGNLEIVLSAKAADFSGTVHDENGDAVQGVPVTLWPKVIDKGRQDGGIHTAYTDQNGSVKISGLAPGDYLVAAWEDVPQQGLNQNPDFLSHFTDSDNSVTLAENGHESKDIKMMPHQRIGTEAAKIP